MRSNLMPYETKAQRKVIYKTVLDKLINSAKSKSFFMCEAICDLVGRYPEEGVDFPEFWAMKPKLEVGQTVWFADTRSGRLTRRKKLLKMIELCEQ